MVSAETWSAVRLTAELAGLSTLLLLLIGTPIAWCLARTRSAWKPLWAALVAMPVLRRFKQRVDPRRYNGAALLGLRGLVFKSHGSADAYAFEQALARAYDAARNRLLDRVHDRLGPTIKALPGGSDAADPAA